MPTSSSLLEAAILLHIVFMPRVPEEKEEEEEPTEKDWLETVQAWGNC